MGGFLVLVALGGLLFLYLKKKANSGRDRHERFLDTLDSFVGAKRDHWWFTHWSGRYFLIATWCDTKRFYYAKDGEALDPIHFFDAKDVRSWSIERTALVRSNAVGYNYDFNIAIKRTDVPLLKVYCGKDEAMAYRMNEIFNQMFGEQVG